MAAAFACPRNFKPFSRRFTPSPAFRTRFPAPFSWNVLCACGFRGLRLGVHSMCLPKSVRWTCDVVRSQQIPTEPSTVTVLQPIVLQDYFTQHGGIHHNEALFGIPGASPCFCLASVSQLSQIGFVA